MTALLEVHAARKAFGAVQAIKDVSFDVDTNEILGLIGPNGSGKTTLFNCITGFERLDGGRVVWQGRDISRWSPGRRARAGLVRTFQQVMVFPEDSVLVNLSHAIRCAGGVGATNGLARPTGLPGGRIEAAAEQTAELVGLGPWAARDVPVGELPHGSQRLVGVGMAMATAPRLLMLDEPAAGLHDDEVGILAGVLRHLHETGISVLVVDHNMHFLLDLCSRVVVLDLGEKLAEGTPAEVRVDPRVVAIYLGSNLGGGGGGGVSAGPDDPADTGSSISTGHRPALATRGGPRSEGEPVDPAPADAVSRLVVEDLCAGYGPVTILRQISIEVDGGGVVAVLGPNGAGKTTLLRAISGAAQITAGRIEYEGRPLNGLQPSAIVGRGVAHVLEGRRVFASLTVQENLQVAVPRSNRANAGEEVAALFDTFPDLARLRTLRGDQLSGGQQQQLAIARALMSKPRLLLLDEPSLGLSPVLVEVMLDVIRRVIAERGISVLLVEQAVWLAKEVAERAYILESGQVVYAGPINELDRDRMANLYFGADARQSA